ncbi:MAG TPA: hypothetical protein VMV26_01185 [Alphaproteobacteria bacterium]|jgi:hypothetical protein|nr:hypothetical protein [Alphaproteobacteria bacterium]
MASAKHPLSLHGAPLARHAADKTIDRDHGRLMPGLVLAAALLALGTSADRGTDTPVAPASQNTAVAAATLRGDLALVADTGTRAALADALSSVR